MVETRWMPASRPPGRRRPVREAARGIETRHDRAAYLGCWSIPETSAEMMIEAPVWGCITASRSVPGCNIHCRHTNALPRCPAHRFPKARFMSAMPFRHRRRTSAFDPASPYGQTLTTPSDSDLYWHHSVMKQPADTRQAAATSSAGSDLPGTVLRSLRPAQEEAPQKLFPPAPLRY